MSRLQLSGYDRHWILSVEGMKRNLEIEDLSQKIMLTVLVRLHFVLVEKRTEFKLEVLANEGTGVVAEDLFVS